MKKIIFCMVFFLSLVMATNLKAQSVRINPYVTFSPYMAQAQLCNYLGRPVMCHMILNGQTSYGVMLNSFLNNTLIYPGQCAYTFLHNYTPAPIINAWATSWCNFL